MSDRDRDDETMPMSRLAAILDAYGAEPRRWPAGERNAAEALIGASSEARALHAAAARFDGALSASVAPAPSAALRAAILQAAPKPEPAATPGIAAVLRGLWQALAGTLAGELGGLRPAGAVLGIALVLGAVTGGAVGTQTAATSTVSAEENVDFVQLALFDDSYGEF